MSIDIESKDGMKERKGNYHNRECCLHISLLPVDICLNISIVCNGLEEQIMLEDVRWIYFEIMLQMEIYERNSR